MKVVFVIKERRRKLRKSLSALAADTGVSRSLLHQIENNKRDNITLKSLHKIARALNAADKDMYRIEED